MRFAIVGRLVSEKVDLGAGQLRVLECKVLIPASPEANLHLLTFARHTGESDPSPARLTPLPERIPASFIHQFERTGSDPAYIQRSIPSTTSQLSLKGTSGEMTLENPSS